MSGTLERLTNVAIIIACVAVAALAMQRLGQQPTQNQRTADSAIANVQSENIVIPLIASASAGPTDSKVVLLEFSDFECPYCGRYARDVFPRIRQTFVDKGLITYVFKNLPLPIHPMAMNASMAAECALEQNQYWQMHDRLFTQQKQFETPQLLKYATDLRLNTDTFSVCLDSAVKERIHGQMREALRLKVTVTPSFFVGVRDGDTVKALKKIIGAQPYEVFEQVLNEVLKSNGQGNVRRQVGS